MALEANKFRQIVTENTLRSCQLFVGLPAADIAAIASFVIPKHLDKGEYLFREGDCSEGFYVVRGARQTFIASVLRAKSR